MNLTEITKTGQTPKYVNDVENKVYIVYDDQGNEYSRHQYKALWDSSPAMRAATKDVNQLRLDIHNKETIDWEGRPLSKAELEYTELKRKSRGYMDMIRSGILDDETKGIYYETMKHWSDRMDVLCANRGVRDSVLMGTYKPATE